MRKGSKTNRAKKRVSKKKTTKRAGVKVRGQGITGNKASARNRQIQWKNQSMDTVTVALEELEIISVEQSGDLQGLSNIECAGSESVDELLEEGNSFEAEVVMGVEEAEDAEEVEVRTHEVPQDDVPAEYLDKEG